MATTSIFDGSEKDKEKRIQEAMDKNGKEFAHLRKDNVTQSMKEHKN